MMSNQKTEANDEHSRETDMHHHQLDSQRCVVTFSRASRTSFHVQRTHCSVDVLVKAKWNAVSNRYVNPAAVDVCLFGVTCTAAVEEMHCKTKCKWW